MRLNKIGDKLTIDGVTFIVGGPVHANDQSDYAGLNGTLLEIRTDADKDTDNETPDLICAFHEPRDYALYHEIQARFSALHGKCMSFGNIALDCVVMAPSMLRPVKNTRIYQIDPDNPDAEQHIFRKLPASEAVPPAVLYRMVNDANFGSDSLEDIFAILNNGAPKNYHGRSLSVSDVVEYEGNLYSAIFNVFVGEFFVDDVDGYIGKADAS